MHKQLTSTAPDSSSVLRTMLSGAVQKSLNVYISVSDEILGS